MKPNKFFLIASMTFLISCSPKNVSVPDDQLNAINALVDGLHLDAHEGNFETYFDPPTTLAKIFSLRGVPTSILINKEGKEFARVIGSIDFEDKNFVNWIKQFN